MSDNPKAAAKIDQLAEFHRLKEETAVINAKMRASAPLLNSPVSSSDALLGIILKELKAMRVEVKEDVKRIEENQNKLHEELREVKEAQKQFAEDQKTITLNQKSHEEKLIQIQEDVASIKWKSQDSDVIDIKQAIFGKWEHINGSSYYCSFKIEGNKFFERFRNSTVDEYTLGVKNSNGFTVTVENDKIIQKWIYENGEEKARYEYYMEDRKLVRTLYVNGVISLKDVFQRIGDPQF